MIPPASTGTERRSRRTVSTTDHTNRGIRSSRIPFHRMFITVVIKLMAPRMDDVPARCSEKMARSTDGPE